MKAKITTLSILLLGLFWVFNVEAQGPIVIKADTVVTCPGPGVHVMVPILVHNWTLLDSVAAFDLVLKFDTNAVNFVAAHNINPALGQLGLFLQNQVDDHWLGTWFSMNIGVLASDTLVVLEFEYLQNWSALTWDTANMTSAFYGFNTMTLPTIWNNGLIGLTGPFVQTQPNPNNAAPSGTNTTFSISGSNITAYQWQISTDNGVTYTDLADGGFYSNVTTGTLNLTNVNPSIDGYMYRNKVTGPCGIQYSAGGKLLVVSTTPIVTSIGASTYCAGSTIIPILVTDFYNVGHWRLKIDFNDGTLNVLTYSNYQGFTNPITITPSTGSVIIDYTGGGISNLGNDTLIQLVFNTIVGTTGFNFDQSNCFYNTPAGSPHFVSFTNTNLTINSLPTSAGTIFGPSAICYTNTAVNYSVNPNGTYLSYVWGLSPPDAGTFVANDTTIAITWDPTFTGTATVTIQGQNACGVGPVNGKFVTVHIPTPLTFAALDSVCLATPPVALTGATPSGGTYSGPGVYNNTFIADSVGVGTTNVTYTYINAYNCESTITKPITVKPLPIVTFAMSPYTAVCWNWSSFFLSGGNPTGGTFSGPGVNSGSGIFTPGFGLTPNGGNQNIKYEVTGLNGCKNSAYDIIHVDVCDGVANQNENLSITVQPNPNHGLFEVNVANLKAEANLSIYNDLGQSVYSEKLSPAAGTNLKLDLSSQPSGLYFLMLNCNGAIQVEKIVLK